MIVIVDDAVFASRRHDALELAALLRLGFEGRHLVHTDPPWAPDQPLAVNSWLAEQYPALREQAELALSAGIEEAIRSPPALTLRVEEGSEPSVSDLRFPLADALRILERPLRLLVENAENDGAFLRTVAFDQWRVELDRALAAGWAEVEHGGGLESMLSLLEGRGSSDRLRLWVLFDSDAREPESPSERSEVVRAHCEAHRIAHHQLRRRAAENYLPLPALAAWTQIVPRNTRKKHHLTYLAFKEMKAPQRHHYNMRQGFAKDEEEGIPPFFGEFAHDPKLRNGFGRGVRGLFKQEKFRFQEDWLRKDGQQEETSLMIRAILCQL